MRRDVFIALLQTVQKKDYFKHLATFPVFPDTLILLVEIMSSTVLLFANQNSFKIKVYVTDNWS